MRSRRIGHEAFDSGRAGNPDDSGAGFSAGGHGHGGPVSCRAVRLQTCELWKSSAYPNRNSARLWFEHAN